LRRSHHLKNLFREKPGLLYDFGMTANEEDTLVIIKPDAFWRHLDGAVEGRVNALGLKKVAEFILADGENLSEDAWKEFYFPAIGDKPERLDGTSKYMAHGPVKVMHLRGEDAIRKVRSILGATRPWLAERGSIRGDFWPGAVEVNAPYRAEFQQPGDDKFVFNLIHASDSEDSFKREIRFLRS
jgi:nucleoside-diphosphate kinase